METIVLTDAKALNIYINPQRQNMLRILRLADEPMTPKQLADRMGISASAAQHHIKKLMELGLVALSHTRRVRGITASYYCVPPKIIQIGGMIEDENAAQRLALMQNALTTTFSGFSTYLQKGAAAADGQHGDMLYGVVRLEKEEAKELYTMIRAFLDAHEQRESGGTPWEYALIAYPATEV